MSGGQKGDFISEVAKHYNEVEQKPLRERSKSVIIDLRRFNNAMKSLMHHLAFKFAVAINNNREKFRVLDLGCGKGGDLPKYLRNDMVSLVVGVDIADVSISQCIERYNSIQQSNRRCFKGEFFVADLTRVDIEKKLLELKCTEKFHVASTQFSIHYSFESFEQAVKYITNAANNLMKHGIFIGTYPDGPKLLKLARQSKTRGLYEVDDILSVKFEPEDLDNPRPFGTKYHFKLREVVDCPEFLVHPEVLRKLMKLLGFYEVFDRSFEENLREAISNPNDGEKVKDIFYAHQALAFDEETKRARLDENMWRAASIYRCFCYKKIRDD